MEYSLLGAQGLVTGTQFIQIRNIEISGEATEYAVQYLILIKQGVGTQVLIKAIPIYKEVLHSESGT